MFVDDLFDKKTLTEAQGGGSPWHSEPEQQQMDADRRGRLGRERNAGLDEPDDAVSGSVPTGNGVYEYTVPAGQESIAQELGLQQHRGHWVSRVPIQRANFQFGRPQFHEIPAPGVAEGSEESYVIVRTDVEGKRDVFAGNFSTYERAQKELDDCLAHPLHTKYKQKFEIKRKGQQGMAEGWGYGDGYDKGFSDGYDGQRKNNPFPPGSKEHKEYDEGWFEGRLDYQKMNRDLDEQGVAEGLSKRDQKDVDAIKAAIERLQAQLKQPNADRDAIQQSIAHEKKRLALYGQGMAEADAPLKHHTARVSYHKEGDPHRRYEAIFKTTHNGGKEETEKRAKAAFAAKKKIVYDIVHEQGVAEAGNKPVEKYRLGMGDNRTARELKTQMQGASDEFVKHAAKDVGPFHSRVAKMQGKLAKSELRRRGQGFGEGMLDNPGEQDSPVAQAIVRRILLQRTDLLAKHGPEKVGQAVDEVADFVGDVDEIGSSDVSGWIRHVEQMLGNMEQDMAEGNMLSKIKAPAAPSSPALAAPRAPAVAETLRQIDRMLESVNSKKSAEIVRAYADQQFAKLGLHNTTECKQIMAHVVHESAVRRRAYAQRMAK
jgi:hypothetical protein